MQMEGFVLALLFFVDVFVYILVDVFLAVFVYASFRCINKISLGPLQSFQRWFLELQTLQC